MSLPEPYYDRDGIKIYCGDCLEIIPHLGSVTIIGDAPYGVGFAYESFDDSEENVATLAAGMKPHLLGAERAALFTGVPQMWLWPRPKWVLCWSYAPMTNEFSPWGFAQWQPILVYGKDPYLAARKGPQPTVLTHNRPPDRRAVPGHPCPKPLPLMQQVVNRVSALSDTVLDPFMGSGTTLVAAKLEGRKAIGIELEEKYCEIAVKRLAQGVLDFGEPATPEAPSE